MGWALGPGLRRGTRFGESGARPYFPAIVSRAARIIQPDLPILFISGYAEEQLRQSIDLPKVAFLAKPFTVQKLAEAARDTRASK